MTETAKKLLAQAMALPSGERGRLGAMLLDSVADDARRETIDRRIDELERGEVEARDAMDVYLRLRAKTTP